MTTLCEMNVFTCSDLGAFVIDLVIGDTNAVSLILSVFSKGEETADLPYFIS